MPRILVVPDNDDRPLMDEYVVPAHLNDQHSSLQLLERLAWAIEDAERRGAGRQRKRGPRDYLHVTGD